MSHTPGALSRVPTVEECLELLRSQRVDEKVYLHSIMVCRVGITICDGLERNGVSINKPLAVAGCLLHDICKLEVGPGSKLVPRRDHAAIGGRLVEALGYPVVAPLVANHVLDQSEVLGSLEEEIVFYSDKRVDFDEVVSLQERLKRLQVRYANNPEAMRNIISSQAVVPLVEKQLLSKAGLTPDSLQSLNSYRGRGAEGLP